MDNSGKYVFPSNKLDSRIKKKEESKWQKISRPCTMVLLRAESVTGGRLEVLGMEPHRWRWQDRS